MVDYDVTPPPDRLASRVQLRLAFSTHRGEVTAFVAQLEYWLGGEWQPVVRYDHGEAHDVSVEGLHLDIYRDGKKLRQESVSAPLHPNAALNYAEDDLYERKQHYIERFERWHDISETANL